MVNSVCFADEKVFIVLALSNMGTKVRCLLRQKLNHLASSVCWCTVLLGHVKVKLSPQTRKCIHFARFCGYNCKTSRICHQQTRL